MGKYAGTRAVLINLLLLRLELQIQTLLRFALVRFGSLCFGSVQFALVRFGSVDSVLCWPGLHMDMGHCICSELIPRDQVSSCAGLGSTWTWDTAICSEFIPRDQVSSFGLVCGSS